MRISHEFTSDKDDAPDESLVKPSDWNADHSIRGSVQPLPDGVLAESTPRAAGTSGQSTSFMTSGRVAYTLIWLPKGVTVGSIGFLSGGSPGASNPTVQKFGLYSLESSSTEGTRLAMTDDDGATAWGINTLKTLTVSGGFLTTYTGSYWVAILIVADTCPTTRGALTNNATLMTPYAAAFGATSLSDLPTTDTPGSTMPAVVPYCVVSA